MVMNWLYKFMFFTVFTKYMEIFEKCLFCYLNSVSDVNKYQYLIFFLYRLNIGNI